MAYLVDDKEQVVHEEAAPLAAAEALPAAGAVKETPALPAVSAPPVSVSGIVPAPRPPGRGATPYARGIAAQRGIDLSAVIGTGPGGVIIAADVRGAPPAGGPAVAGFPQVDVPGDDHKDHSRGHHSNRRRLDRKVEEIARRQETAAGRNVENDPDDQQGADHSDEAKIDLHRAQEVRGTPPGGRRCR